MLQFIAGKPEKCESEFAFLVEAILTQVTLVIHDGHDAPEPKHRTGRDRIR
jgi:hypothetical protein